jgi:hypothetical protein
MFMATITSPCCADHDARRRSAVLATCCLSVFIAGIDVTIVNVALPWIQGAPHASVSGLQWTIAAYTLATAERNGARLATAMSLTPQGAR